MKVDTEVMALLSASRTEGNKLFITGGQLERGLYARLDKTLKAAGGKWNTKAKAHLFADDAAEAIENIILTGEVAVPQDFGFFPTPGRVVDRLLEFAQLDERNAALECMTTTATGYKSELTERDALLRERLELHRRQQQPVTLHERTEVALSASAEPSASAATSGKCLDGGDCGIGGTCKWCPHTSASPAQQPS